MRALLPGYESISAGVREVLVPGYEGISAGVRGYKCWGTRVLIPGYKCNSASIFGSTRHLFITTALIYNPGTNL